MNVFISSVVRNFEQYRAVAKKAVTLLGHMPVMCEEFGARPYSSQEACMTEVDQADVVVLILGADFGFTTSTGESVTQQEFRRAKAGGKPVLAFLEDVEVEGPQRNFRSEVSDYVDGLFRATFTDEHDLSDGIVRALSQLTISRNAISEQEFVQRLQQRKSYGQGSNWNSAARFELAFLPQPVLSGTLRAVHSQHEAFFLKLCQAGLGVLKDGYNDFDQGETTGLDTKNVVWRYHDCGMSWLSVSLVTPSKTNDPFASYYISPSRVRAVAEAAFGLISQGKGGWFQLGLYNLTYQVFQEPPAVPSNTLSIRHSSEHQVEERHLLIPASQAAYNRWMDDVLFRIGRKLSQ